METELTLRLGQVGKMYKVRRIVGSGPVRRRIMDMGITKNAEVFLTKVAPLGDPIQIEIRGYQLSVRKDDADIILVEEIEGASNEN